jgi:hypothetical protein
MKNQINYLFKITCPFVFVGIILLYSCKKDNTEELAPTTPVNAPTGTFMFHLHTYLDLNEVDLYGITYTTTAGRNISLSMAQLYISDIQLVKLDGSTYTVSGKKLLKVLEADTYLVGNVPVGNYKTIRFKVGLDASSNQLNPTATADSIVLNRPAMWFGNTAQPDGYVFLNVQGMIDTSTTMSGTPVPFSYKIGTNANYKQVVMPDKNFSVVENQVTFDHLWVDYNQLFTGIQLNQNSNLFVTTVADNSTALATTIVNNIPAMFVYEP